MTTLKERLTDRLYTILSAEYHAWLAANGLTDLGSADEHLFDPRLTEKQRAWIRDFSERWSKIDPYPTYAADRLMVRQIIQDALALGYSISVSDGEETALVRSTDPDAIYGEMFACDEETLRFYPANDPKSARAGSVFLVYGNGGWDVMCDWSDNEATNAILAGANALSDQLSALEDA